MEQWEYHVVERFLAHCLARYGKKPQPKHTKSFLIQFRGQKTLSAVKVIEFMTQGPNRNTMMASLKAKELRRDWSIALKRPIDTFKKQVAKQASMAKKGVISKPLVVVSGGTSLNLNVKKILRQICNKKRLPMRFVQDTDLRVAYQWVDFPLPLPPTRI